MSVITIDLDTAVSEVKVLSTMPKWPFEPEGQMELVRITREYGRDLTHVRQTIREISENWDHCPAARELREALTGQATSTVPAFQGRTTCPLSLCDGSGWLQVFWLHTQERSASGGNFTRKEQLTADQAKALDKQIDRKTQEIYSGAKRCACRPAVMTQEGK